MPRLIGMDGNKGAISHAPPGGKPSSHQPRPGSGNTSGQNLAITLLFPGFAVIVISKTLPESWSVTIQELEAAHPLGAFPEVQVWNEQPQRPAVLGRDWLAIAPIDQHVLRSQKIVQRQVGGVAVLGADHDVRGL